MDTPTDKYLEALRRFADAGDLKMARSVAASMAQREVPLEVPHLHLLLKANLAGRDASGARKVIEQLTAAGGTVEPTVRYDMAIASSRAGRLADAVAELDALHAEGIHPEPRHMLELISIHVRSGRFPAARALVRKMAAEGRAARPGDYDALFKDLHERKAIKDSVAQVEYMVQAGHPPTPDQGRALVAMMAEAAHPDRATALLDQLWSADVAVPVDVLSDILDAHARAGDAEAVAATVARMAEVGAEPNSFHRNAMFSARLTAGDLDGAWEMADEFIAGWHIPTGANLDALFDATLASGNLLRASGIIDWALILGVQISPQKVATAVEAHLQAGELKVARWIFDESARCGVVRDRKAARGIVEETIRSGDLDGARALLSDLLASETLTHGRHWGSLLRALMGASRLDDAVAVVAELLTAGVAPAASDLIRLVHTLLDAEKAKPAHDLALGALAVGAEVDATNYGELLWLFAKVKHVESTEAIHAWMVEKGVEVEHRHLKAVAHAKGEVLPDPEPAPAPVAPPAAEAPVVEAPAAEAAADAAPTTPVDPAAPADWELAIEGAIIAETAAAGAAEAAPVAAELPDAAPDEANDAALVEATLGDEPEVEAAPEPVAEVTDAELAVGSAPAEVSEDAPADEPLATEQTQAEPAESEPAESEPAATAESEPAATAETEPAATAETEPAEAESS